MFNAAETFISLGSSGSQSRDIIAFADTTCWQMPHSSSSEALANHHALAPSPASVSDPVPDLAPTSLRSAAGRWPGGLCVYTACLVAAVHHRRYASGANNTVRLCVNEKQ